MGDSQGDMRNVPPDKNDLGQCSTQEENMSTEVMEFTHSGDKNMTDINMEVIGKSDVTDEIKEKVYPQFQYETIDKGPYVVFIEGTGNGNGIGRLHPMALGKLIYNSHPEIKKFISSVKKIGRNRIKVELINRESANCLIGSQLLKEKNLVTYAPTFILQRQGIIRGVFHELSDEDIAKDVQSSSYEPVMVIKARRFSRKVVEAGQTKFVPTQTVLLTFRGQTLPDYVTLHYVRCPVEPYIQKINQCFKCLRYGHKSEKCNSSVRCSKCGQQHLSKDCSADTPVKCVHCNGEHSALSKSKCPEFSKQQSIRSLMTEENLSFTEAREKLNSNSFRGALVNQVPTINHKSVFPPLHTTNRVPPKRLRPNSPPDKDNTSEKYKKILASYSPDWYKSQPITKNPYPPNYENIRGKPSQKLTVDVNKFCEALFEIVTSLKNVDSSNKNDILKEIKVRVEHFGLFE